MPDTFVALLISRLAIASVEFLFVALLAGAVCAFFPSIAPKWRRVIWLMVLCKPAVTICTSFFGGALPVPAAITGQMIGDVLFPKAADGLLASHGTAGTVLHLMAGAWVVVTITLLLRVWLRTVTSTRLIDESLQKGYMLKPRSLRLLDPKLVLPPHIKVIVTPEDAGPATIGVFRPAVIVPDHLLPWVNRHRDPIGNERARLCQVLRHELAHVANRDSLYSFFATLLVSFFWFHPVAHFAYRRIRLINELCCDETVVASGVPAADYVETLMSVVSGRFSRSGFAMSILGDISPRNVLRYRLQHLLSGCERSAGRKQVAAFATIALLFLSMPRFLADTPVEMLRILTAQGDVVVVRVDDLHMYMGYTVLSEGTDVAAVLAARANPDARKFAAEISGAAKTLSRLAHVEVATSDPVPAAGAQPAVEGTGGDRVASIDDIMDKPPRSSSGDSHPPRHIAPLAPEIPNEPQPILPPPPNSR